MTVAQLSIKIGADWGEAKRAFNDVTAAVKPLGDTLQQTGRTLSTYVTLPLVAAGTAAAKFASDFQSAFARMEGLVGVPVEELRTMERAVLALGDTTGQGPIKLAEALFFITSAGIRGSDAMEVLEASGKAAAAGLGDVSTIADLATSAMNAYGAGNLTAVQAVDDLTSAVRLGKLQPDELAGAMGRVLPMASALGVGFDEVGAAMAAMSKTGTNASEAATQIRSILNTILSPSKGAQDALAGVGLSAEMLRTSLAEEGLLPTLEMMVGAFGGNVTAMEAVFGNVRALSGVMDMLGSNVEVTRSIFAEMVDTTGSLDAAFAAVEGTMEFQFNRALANGQTLLLAFRDVMANVLTPAFSALATAFKWVADLIEGANPVVRYAIVGFAAFAAAIGPLLVVLGTLIKLLPVLVVGFKGFLAVLAVMGGPIGAAILAVTALTAAGVYLYKNWETVRLQIGAIMHSIAAVTASAMHAAVDSIMLVALAAARIPGPMQSAALAALGPLASVSQGLARTADEAEASAARMRTALKIRADLARHYAGGGGASGGAGASGGGFVPELPPFIPPGGGGGGSAAAPVSRALSGMEGLTGAGPAALGPGLSDLSGLSVEAVQQVELFDAKLAALNERIKATITDMGQAIHQGLGQALIGLAEGFGAMAAGTGSLGDMGRALLTTFAGIMQKLGGLLVAFALSGIKFQAGGGFLSFLLNPWNALAAGGLLIAAGAAIKGLLSSASGGGGGRGAIGLSSGGNINPNTGSTAGTGSGYGVGSGSNAQQGGGELRGVVVPSGDLVFSIERGQQRLSTYGNLDA